MPDQNKRPLFLTLWLSILIVTNAAGAIFYFLKAPTLHMYIPTLPVEIIHLFGLFMLVNVIFALALFKWKIWGFWGYCLLSLIASGFSLFYAVVGVTHAIIGTALPILILFWALNVGKENKAWKRLTW